VTFVTIRFQDFAVKRARRGEKIVRVYPRRDPGTPGGGKGARCASWFLSETYSTDRKVKRGRVDRGKSKACGDKLPTFAFPRLHDFEHFIVRNGFDLGQRNAPFSCLLRPLLLDRVREDLRKRKRRKRKCMKHAGYHD
jgi:hypothetical protein